MIKIFPIALVIGLLATFVVGYSTMEIHYYKDLKEIFRSEWIANYNKDDFASRVVYQKRINFKYLLCILTLISVTYFSDKYLKQSVVPTYLRKIEENYIEVYDKAVKFDIKPSEFIARNIKIISTIVAVICAINFTAKNADVNLAHRYYLHEKEITGSHWITLQRKETLAMFREMDRDYEKFKSKERVDTGLDYKREFDFAFLLLLFVMVFIFVKILMTLLLYFYLLVVT